MARTLYFNDGTSEVLFQDQAAGFARILSDKLGQDAERFYLETIDHDEKIEKLGDDLDCANGQIENLEEQKTDLESRLTEKERETDDLTNRLSEAADGIENLATRVLAGDMSPLAIAGALKSMASDVRPV